jgi:hypothetical protein
VHGSKRIHARRPAIATDPRRALIERLDAALTMARDLTSTLEVG